MVTINPNLALMATERAIDNKPHQHAFVLLGKGKDSDENGLDYAFGVHMTQYHCELHKYQIILKYQFDFSAATVIGLSLDGLGADSETVPMDFYARLRKLYPDVTFFLCNANNHDDAEALPDLRKEFSIPELGSQSVQEFHGHIFFGIKPPTEKDEDNDHFFPWSADRCLPVVKNVKVICERVVLYRPFDHVQQLPPYALYYLFGERDEAFMTHLQTAQVSNSLFTPKNYGPDYDDVVALTSVPLESHGHDQEPVPVLGDALLKAGVVVSVPALPLTNDEDHPYPHYPLPLLFRNPKPVTLMYRGTGPEFSVTPKQVYLFASAICNSPDRDCYPIDATVWTLMPERYWVQSEGN